MSSLNLIGKVFGSLVVVEKLDSRVTGKSPRDKKRFWKCRCECGKFTELATSTLTTGNTKSCGCGKYNGSLQGTHNMSDTRFYNIWQHMLKRSDPDKSKRPKAYRDKNTDRDVSWGCFESFYNDMWETYADDLTLDRLDNTKGYCKDNCRWASSATQSRNRGKMKSNESGVTGVYWKVNTDTKGREYTLAVATWTDSGKTHTKSFSVKKYGLLESFALAVKYRKEQIERLNKLGYGYTDTHGQ